MIKCPVCESNKVNLIRTDKQGKRYIHCSQCSHIWFGNAPTKKELEEFYGQYHEMKGFGVKRQLKEWSENSVKIVKDILAAKPNTKTILDYGGGDGFLANTLQEKGFNVTLFEPFKETIQRTKKRFPRLKVKQNEEKLGLFDVVICNQVIEHVIDPIELVQKLYEHTKPDGTLIISTPNRKNLQYFAQLKGTLRLIKDTSFKEKILFLKYPWGVLLYPEHVQGFTKKSIFTILERNGFWVVHYYTEYRTSMNYMMKPEYDMKLVSWRSFFKIAYNFYEIIVLKVLTIVVPSGGFNQIIICKKELVD